jgi:hypothetical protein
VSILIGALDVILGVGLIAGFAVGISIFFGGGALLLHLNDKQWEKIEAGEDLIDLNKLRRRCRYLLWASVTLAMVGLVTDLTYRETDVGAFKGLTLFSWGTGLLLVSMTLGILMFLTQQRRTEDP